MKVAIGIISLLFAIWAIIQSIITLIINPIAGIAAIILLVTFVLAGLITIFGRNSKGALTVAGILYLLGGLIALFMGIGRDTFVIVLAIVSIVFAAILLVLAIKMTTEPPKRKPGRPKKKA